MSEEVSHKRKREDSEEPKRDEYEPSLETGLAETGKSDLPPHLQGQEVSQESGASEAPLSEQPREQEGDEFGGFKRQRRTNVLPRVIELAKNIVHDIARMGDNPIYLRKDMEYISVPISKELETSDEFRSSIMEFLYAMIIEQPHKLFHMSALVQVCNAKNSKVGQYLVDYLHFQVQEILNSLKKDQTEESDKDQDEEAMMLIFGSSECGPWDRIKLILRFLACLTPIIEDFAIVAIFQQFLETSIELQGKSTDDEETPLSDLIYFSTVMSIPYIVASDRENVELKEKCKGLIEIAQGYKINETKKSAIEIYNHYHGEELPYEPKTLVEMALPSVVKVMENNWEEIDLFQDVKPLVDSIISGNKEEIKVVGSEEGDKGEDQFEATDEFDETKKEKVESEEVKEIVKHKLPQFNIPSIDILVKQIKLDKSIGNIDLLFRYPRFKMEIFKPFEKANYEFEIMPESSSYSSLIIGDIIQDMIQNMEYNKIIVCKQLSNLNNFFNSKKFCKVNSSFDKLILLNDLNNGIDLLEYIENNENLKDDANTKEELIKSAKYVIEERNQDFKSTWKLELMIIENILNLMFSLPLASNPIIYYQSLLIELCDRDLNNIRKRNQRNHGNNGNTEDQLSFARLLSIGINQLFKQINQMDLELINRFIDLMMIQLNNFRFEWNWNEWIEELEKSNEEEEANVIYFIKNIIHKEIRMSNPFIIKRSLSSKLYKFLKMDLYSLQELIEFDSQFFGSKLSEIINRQNFQENSIDNIVEIKDGGNSDYYQLINQFLFNNQDHQFANTCHLLYNNIQENESLQSFNDLIKELREKINEENEKQGDLIIKDIDKYIFILVIQSICIIGSRSLSVIEEGALELVKSKLEKLLGITNENETIEELVDDQFGEINSEIRQDREKWIIEGVLRLWNNEPRIGYLILEKFEIKGFLRSELIIQNLIDLKVIINESYSLEIIDRLINENDELKKFYINELRKIQENSGSGNYNVGEVVRVGELIKSFTRREGDQF